MKGSTLGGEALRCPVSLRRCLARYPLSHGWMMLPSAGHEWPRQPWEGTEQERTKVRCVSRKLLAAERVVDEGAWRMEGRGWSGEEREEGTETQRR